MAKAEKAKSKPKPKSKFTDKEQSERFIEAARKLGIEEHTQKFNEIFDKIARLKQKAN
jgi:hypothetical protein